MSSWTCQKHNDRKLSSESSHLQISGSNSESLTVHKRFDLDKIRVHDLFADSTLLAGSITSQQSLLCSHAQAYWKSTLLKVDGSSAPYNGNLCPDNTLDKKCLKLSSGLAQTTFTVWRKFDLRSLVFVCRSKMTVICHQCCSMSCSTMLVFSVDRYEL